MNKIQEALDYINKSICTLLALRGVQDKQVIKSLHILQEAVDKANKYDELQKVYFKNEPMESADLNPIKLQELYDLNSKLIEKETPMTPHISESVLENWNKALCLCCKNFTYYYSLKPEPIHCSYCGKRFRNDE